MTASCESRSSKQVYTPRPFAAPVPIQLFIELVLLNTDIPKAQSDIQ